MNLAVLGIEDNYSRGPGDDRWQIMQANGLHNGTRWPDEDPTASNPTKPSKYGNWHKFNIKY